MKKDVARRALLLDFYGALLTEKQREIYDWYYQQDLSLGEISEEAGVSRNAIHDLINRTDSKLERYEGLLGMIAARAHQEKEAAELVLLLDSWLAEHGGGLKPAATKSLSELIDKARAFQTQQT